MTPGLLFFLSSIIVLLSFSWDVFEKSPWALLVLVFFQWTVIYYSLIVISLSCFNNFSGLYCNSIAIFRAPFLLLWIQKAPWNWWINEDVGGEERHKPIILQFFNLVCVLEHLISGSFIHMLSHWLQQSVIVTAALLIQKQS